MNSDEILKRIEILEKNVADLKSILKHINSQFEIFKNSIEKEKP